MYTISPKITPSEIETSAVLGTTEVRRDAGKFVVRWLFEFGAFSSARSCRSEWKVVAGFLFCVQATRFEEGAYLCAARAWEPGMGEVVVEFHFRGDRAGPLTLRMRQGAHCEPVWFCHDKFVGLQDGTACTVVCKIPVESPDDTPDGPEVPVPRDALEARFNALSGCCLKAVIDYVMRGRFPGLLDCEEASRLLQAARDLGLPVLEEYCDAFLASLVDRRSCIKIMAGMLDLQDTEAFRKSLSHFVFFFGDVRKSAALHSKPSSAGTAKPLETSRLLMLSIVPGSV